MLAIAEWSLFALLLLFIGGFLLYVRLDTENSPSYEFGRLGREVITNVHDELRRDFNRDYRSRQIENVRRDMQFAERLMELERDAHSLRTRYARRDKNGPEYSDTVQEAIERLDAEIAEMKRRRYS
ncbi:MAG: hypothetical protein WCA32_03215 [Chromatiaceae bacterium]